MKLEIEIPFKKKYDDNAFKINLNFLRKISNKMLDMGNYHEFPESDVEDVILALFKIQASEQEKNKKVLDK